MSAGPLAVSVHALDAGSGEGLIADSAVFAELDCRAASVATSLLAATPLPLDLLARQLEAVERLAPLASVRVGFVGGAEQIELVARFASRLAGETTVVAPADADTFSAMRVHLVPAARVVVMRAVALASVLGREVDGLDGLRDAAKALRELGAKAVLIAGWVKRGRVYDLLDDEGEIALLDTSRIQAPRVPGLAGAHAAALAAHLGRGLPLAAAADAAQRYVGFRLMRGR